MSWKTIFALLIILLLFGAAIGDAKGKSGGRSSGSSGKSFSAPPSYSLKESAAKAVGASALPVVAKSTKKKLHYDDDDDLDGADNSTTNSTGEEAKPSPAGILSPLIAIGSLLMARRWRNTNR